MDREVKELLERTKDVRLSDHAEALYHLARHNYSQGDEGTAARCVVLAAIAEWGDDDEEPADDDYLAA